MKVFLLAQSFYWNEIIRWKTHLKQNSTARDRIQNQYQLNHRLRYYKSIPIHLTQRFKIAVRVSHKLLIDFWSLYRHFGPKLDFFPHSVSFTDDVVLPHSEKCMGKYKIFVRFFFFSFSQYFHSSMNFMMRKWRCGLHNEEYFSIYPFSTFIYDFLSSTWTWSPNQSWKQSFSN